MAVIRRHQVANCLLKGWSPVEIRYYLTTKKNGKDVHIFRGLADVHKLVKEVYQMWAREDEAQADPLKVSLSRTVRLFDKQLFRLNAMLEEQGGQNDEGYDPDKAEERRINIEKRITEVAMAKHKLILETEAARKRAEAGLAPR